VAACYDPTMKNTPSTRLDRRDFVKATLAAAALSVASAGRVFGQAPSAGDSASTLTAVSRSGKALSLARSDVAVFGAGLRGQLILPDDPAYEQARKIWNGSFDRHPAMIARCVSAADVVHAVNFARASDILTAVRGGGHSISGQSVCEGGLVLDLSPMKGIRIDPVARTAQAQPGVLLGELDREAQAFGLITTLGTASDTGIAGLTLGGGLGRLARRYGFSCDNLLSVDIVTADGKLLRASERENPDLFWAVRGGGGNFGVVTQFEYRLHPFGPNVLGGLLMFPFDRANRILAALGEFTESAPDEMYLNPMIAKGPEGRMIGFEVCYSGVPAEGERLIAPLKKLDKVLAENIGVKSYLAVQSSFDSGLPAGRAYYFKSGFTGPVTPGMADEIVEVFRSAPPSLMSVPMIHLGGASGRVKPTATAYWNRGAHHDIAVWATWNDRADSERMIADVRAFWRKLEHLTKGYYVNTDSPEDERRLRETYGGNYSRLVQLKDKYDPKNLFRLNSNIKPSSAAAA
jgi:FAD/FMN-containing dehydrogenase